MPFTGSQQLAAVSRDLRVAGTPARGLNRKVRRNITAAMAPMKAQVQRNALAIPATGTKSTGLRQALAKATRISIGTGVRTIFVRLIVDGKRLPADQQALPQLMEGERRWRHPLYGDTEHWYSQPAHPFVAPAIPRTVLAADRGVAAALDQTATELSRGNTK